MIQPPLVFQDFSVPKSLIPIKFTLDRADVEV